MRKVVDLPAPLGPSRPKISPARTVKLMWSAAVNVPKRLVSPCATMRSGASTLSRATCPPPSPPVLP